MKIKTFYIKKIIIFSFTFLISVPLSYSQTTPNTQRMQKKNYKYGEDIELKINENFITEDNMSIKLDHFINKRVFPGQPSEARVILMVSKGSKKTSLTFSVVDGNDNVLEFWNGYKFQLKRMNYEESIKIVITKNKTNFKYGDILELRRKENFIAEDTMSIRLQDFVFYENEPINAELTIFKNNEKISLEISLIKDECDHYVPTLWNEYKFQLKSFNPIESIKIIVTKN